jgi:hypothetical protein
MNEQIQRDYEWLTFFRTLAAIARDHGFDDIADAAQAEAETFEKWMLERTVAKDDKMGDG